MEQRLERVILELADARGPAKSICPSEAARAVDADGWRDLMDQARAVARDLAVRGRVVVTSGGQELSPAGEWRGPIRIRTTKSQTSDASRTDAGRG
ncbi:S-adenosylmethionine tRNA ribosyltransferase [Lentzea guizhouensis]|uniref:S-adenosylmethionine tRNA ribosyltransferase n=1 Tax=Lentzea guizhouensis TaxID=1586287 RepID=A0A1B2I0L6_9PSEU|nr:S-adenosylmethionine tRNA ribosyltransferase [Lentzea guizhouensis]